MVERNPLDLVVVPLAIAFLPLIWSLTTSVIRQIQFRDLILREIEETGPYPTTRLENTSGKTWTDHQTKKRFLHREIFDKPTENRDFILSLQPDLVYYVTQLWQSTNDADQWLYMLDRIKSQVPFWRRSQYKKIEQLKNAWSILMKEYEV